MFSVNEYDRSAVNQFNRAVIAEFRANDGTVGGRFAGAPLLLLTTTGARSGQPRTSPLTYATDGERFVVIAAKRGAPTNPDWYHNLAAHPETTVELGSETFQVRAVVPDGAERDRLFDQMAAQRPAFADYQRNSARRFPVLILERVPR